MILDTGVINGLLRATDRAIPGPQDGQVQVPNLLLIGHEPLLPLDVLSDSAAVQRGSFFFSFQRQVAGNDPGGTDPLVTLGAGLWTIDVEAYISTTVALQNILVCNMSYQGYSIRIAGCSGPDATPEFKKQIRVLLRDQASLEVEWSATAVGEYNYFNGCVFCTRHL